MLLVYPHMLLAAAAQWQQEQPLLAGQVQLGVLTVKQQRAML
jgi:hypothetical protein